MPWLSASHFLPWSMCDVLERGRNNTSHQPFSDVHGGGNPSWPSLTPYDLFKWQYKTSWHLFISTVCACDSFTQNSLPKPSFLIYFHCPWNILFKPSSPLFIYPLGIKFQPCNTCPFELLCKFTVYMRVRFAALQHSKSTDNISPKDRGPPTAGYWNS